MRAEIIKLRQRIKHHLHLRHARPDRGHDPRRPHRHHARRLHPADRHSRRRSSITPPTSSSSGLHRHASDELLRRRAQKDRRQVPVVFTVPSSPSPRRSRRASVPTTPRPALVVLGVRPEHITLCDGSVPHFVRANVDVSEMMGLPSTCTSMRAERTSSSSSLPSSCLRTTRWATATARRSILPSATTSSTFSTASGKALTLKTGKATKFHMKPVDLFEFLQKRAYAPLFCW